MEGLPLEELPIEIGKPLDEYVEVGDARQKVRYERHPDVFLSQERLYKMVARYDPNTGERIADERQPLMMQSLYNQRDGLLAELARIEAEIAAGEEAISVLGPEIIENPFEIEEPVGDLGKGK